MPDKNKSQKQSSISSLSSPFWSGWKDEKPSQKQRTEMLKKCGNKCFLSSPKGYPICRKNSCKVSQKGVMSAYIRARQMKRQDIADNAIKRMTKKTLKHLRLDSK